MDKKLEELIKDKPQREQQIIKMSNEWNDATNYAKFIGDEEIKFNSLINELYENKTEDINEIQKINKNFVDEVNKILKDCTSKLCKGNVFNSNSKKKCIINIMNNIYSTQKNKHQLYLDEVMYPAKMLFGLKSSLSPRAFNYFKEKLINTKFKDKIKPMEDQTINNGEWLFRSFSKFVCDRNIYISDAYARWKAWFSTQLNATQTGLLEKKIKEDNEKTILLNKLKNIDANTEKTTFNSSDEIDEIYYNAKKTYEKNYKVVNENTGEGFEIIMPDVDEKYYDLEIIKSL